MICPDGEPDSGISHEVIVSKKCKFDEIDKSLYFDQLLDDRSKVMTDTPSQSFIGNTDF